MWATTRSRLPPEPWSTQHRRAVARRARTRRTASRPSAVGDRHLLVRDAERGLLDRPARRVGDQQHLRERHQQRPGRTRPRRRASPRRGRAASDARRAGPARRGERGGGRRRRSSERRRATIPTPVRSRQSGPELTTCRPCETTPKPSASRPTTSAEREPGRPDEARLQRRTTRPGTATIASTPEHRRVGAGDREVEQVQRRRARARPPGAGAPGGRAAPAARPAARAAGRGVGGGGGHS